MKTTQDTVVATFDHHLEAEAAIKALQKAGIDMKALSIIGKDFQTEEHVLGFYTANDRMQSWGGRGALWGSALGLLFGSAVFFVPAVGPLIVMGPLAGWLAGALEGAVVGGASGVVAAALSSVGIEKENSLSYELEVKTGKFLVLVRGTPELVQAARKVLSTTPATRVNEHLHQERNAILGLLSDDEVARVSTAETTAKLAIGDEYVDLEHLSLGVRLATGVATPMGHVLPRKAIHEATWKRILGQLDASGTRPSSRA